MADAPPFPTQAAENPAALYLQRLGQRRADLAQSQRRSLLLSYGRLLWAIIAVVMAWYIFGRHQLPWPSLLLPLVGFGVTARLHSRVFAAGAQQRRAITWYEHGIARLEDRWAGLRPRATPAAAAESLFATDLDLFGAASLFELLCTTRTSLGEEALAAFLLQPAPPAEVIGRQRAVAELRDRVPLREALASANGPLRLQLDAPALAQWGEAEAKALPRQLGWLAPLLVALTLGAVVFWATGHSPAPLSAALLLNGVFTFSLQRRFKPLLEQVEQVAPPLRLLAELFAILEGQTFTAETLCAAQTCLRLGQPASKAIRQLARFASAAEQRANLLTRLLDFGILYSVQLALLAQGWRTRHGRQLRSWFEAFAEMEALLSLSAYHFEHPEDPFPEMAGEAVLEARSLGHPLLAQNRCVRNDLTLDPATQLLIVSGSNMSGKSTLLRATGVACVMAMAGAPVRASSLRLGPLRVAASIQVQDSLQGGRSRFYAEILRLRAVCEVARTDGPVLFLLDELLAGTNSHDRLAGAAGVVETLLRAGALGLLSTHDLALTQLGAELQARIRNAHFEDRIEGEGLHFDYTLRDGVITRSNGLDLMRLIGLEV